jgi:hypothetical protein
LGFRGFEHDETRTQKRTQSQHGDESQHDNFLLNTEPDATCDSNDDFCIDIVKKRPDDSVIVASIHFVTCTHITIDSIKRILEITESVNDLVFLECEHITTDSITRWCSANTKENYDFVDNNGCLFLSRDVIKHDLPAVRKNDKTRVDVVNCVKCPRCLLLVEAKDCEKNKMTIREMAEQNNNQIKQTQIAYWSNLGRNKTYSQ